MVFVGSPRMVMTTYHHRFPDAMNNNIYALWVRISTIFKIPERLWFKSDYHVLSLLACNLMFLDTRNKNMIKKRYC
jgi:hypothetical protein